MSVFQSVLTYFWPLFCRDSRQMATAHPLPAAVETRKPGTAAEDEVACAQALVSAPQQEEEAGPMRFGGPVARLPVQLDVAIPVRGFRVRNLLALEAGQVIESQWSNGDDLPLASGEVQLAWSEFEVIDTQLAVRVTRLA
jgi:flagellar motor switch/type III secretory pathway protein FliN